MVVTEESVRRLSRYAAISEEEARAAPGATRWRRWLCWSGRGASAWTPPQAAPGRTPMPRIPALLTRPPRRNRSRSGETASGAG